MDNNTITWPGWETVRVIGRGSFGTVYEIQRNIFGDVEKAALKHIPIPHTSDDIANLQNAGMDNERIVNTFRDQLDLIVREYKLMRRLNDCPYVVRCDDILYPQKADGLGWDILMKMELLTPLTKVLREQKEITEDMVIALGIDICQALIPCEQYNILHRDIKIQNIFVAKDGKYKLGDFGIAKAKEKTGTDTARIGTYDYMAPEVYFGKRYDKTVDIYSLGIVMYWMLNNRRMPFITQSKEPPTFQEREAARRRRLKGDDIPLPVNGSSRLKQIVTRCCAYDPKARFQDAAQLLEELFALQHAQDTLTNEPTVKPAPALLIRVTTGEVFTIKKDITVLGRKKELVDLIITGNPGISREHAAIVKRENQYLLHNFRPKSGTEVNRKELAWDADAELSSCSEITLADEQFFFLYGTASESVSSAGKVSMLRSEATGVARLLPNGLNSSTELRNGDRISVSGVRYIYTELRV